jgi:hypothetical protein
MISAICDDTLPSEFTNSRNAWLMRPSEASFGQELMRLRMMSSEYLAGAMGGWEEIGMKEVAIPSPEVVSGGRRSC